MPKIEIPIDRIGKLPPVNVSRNQKAVGGSEGNDIATKKVGITTLGCKVNTYESELIAETLQTQNWELVSSNNAADLYLINTCTVTREADRQARQAVRKVVKCNPSAIVVVTGCYAQIDPDACAKIPGVDLVLGNDRKLDELWWVTLMNM